MSEMENYGLTSLDNGFHVLPIEPAQKRPSIWDGERWRGLKRWPQYCDEPPSALDVQTWAAMPLCGVGIACGYACVAIDIDVLDKNQAWKIEVAAREHLGDTPLKRVGMEPKRLLVYRAAPGSRIASRGGKVEILSYGRQFVAFGIHEKTGQPYRWVSGESPASFDVMNLPAITQDDVDAFFKACAPFIPARESMPRAADRHSSDLGQLGTVEAVTDALKWIPNEGYDVDYDKWISVALAIKAAVGWDGWEAFDEWSKRSDKYDPHFTSKKWETETPRKKVQNIGAGSIYFLASENGWTPPPGVYLNPSDKTASELVTLNTKEFQKTAAEAARRERTLKRISASTVQTILDEAPTSMRAFVKWSIDTASRPQGYLSLGAFITFLGTLAGRKYASETGARTNVYALGIGDSGSGKDHARKLINIVSEEIGANDYLGGAQALSDSAILSALAEHPARLYLLDEFGHFLKSVLSNRASTHQSQMWALMTELYSTSSGVYRGKDYADRKLRPTSIIPQPTLSVFGTTVPQVLWAALGEGAINDGSLARFLMFRTPNDYPDSQTPCDPGKAPGLVLKTCRQIMEGAKHWDGGGVKDLGPMLCEANPRPHVVKYDKHARAAFEAFGRYETTKLRESAGTSHSAIIARMRENAARVALIAAISDNPLNPIINLRHWSWAEALIRHSAQTMISEAQAHISDTREGAEIKKLIRLIRAEGEGGIAHSRLLRNSNMRARDFNAIMQTLEQSNQIFVVETKPKKGPPIRKYIAQEENVTVSDSEE